MHSDTSDNEDSSMSAIDSYEKCMEALSSLITSKKRGDGSTAERKFLSMLKYVKVIILNCKSEAVKRWKIIVIRLFGFCIEGESYIVFVYLTEIL